MEVVDPVEVVAVVDAQAAVEVVQVVVAVVQVVEAVVTLPFFCKKHRNQVLLSLKAKK